MIPPTQDTNVFVCKYIDKRYATPIYGMNDNLDMEVYGMEDNNVCLVSLEIRRLGPYNYLDFVWSNGTRDEHATKSFSTYQLYSKSKSDPLLMFCDLNS